ncbi:MAG TPA: UDP-N-acetylglucosamine 2-epimerase, partial [Candidatus Margulisiibacteriota bacterium]|nr:UDP-N-acetylglucosamine 2-epimerase [Candidatus Margulisiibacteriota bacterium]
MKKRILFLTGTRADFGKLKPLMLAVENSSNFECLVFVTGMHLLSKYGLTVEEVQNAKFKNIYTYVNQMHGEPMELILANTINGLSRYVHEYRPDLIVVHGDRVEALAGAIIGALSNILVAHIEGGEISGTVDEIMRHAVSKLSHVHFVANEVSANRLIQLGEARESIYIIGSPEIDIMLSNKLPKIKKVKQRYGISFARYGIVLFHPVTTEVVQQRKYAQELVAALISSKQNFVVIYPNNDLGSDEIFDAYGALKDRPGFKILPSMRFEYFLSLLKHTRIIVGNSSVGMREA